MKINYDLEFPYRPRAKCGAEIIAAGITAGAGLAGSLFNTSSTSSTNSKSMFWQSQENEKNRIFNAGEAEKQRNWMSNEWLSQFNKQREEWYNQLAAQQDAQRAQFDYEAEYNSPQNQLKRLQNTGVNAAAMFSQSGSGLIPASAGNMGNAPSPSAPTGGTVSGSSASASPVGAPNIHAPQFDLGSLGDFLSQTVKAYKENATLRPQIQQMWQSIALTTAQLAGQELANSFQETQNYIAHATKNYKVHQAYLDLALTANEINLKASQGKAYDAEAFEKATAGFLNLAKEKCSKQEYLALSFQVANQSRLFEANLSRIMSETGKNVSQSALNWSLKASEDDLRKFKVENADLTNQVMRIDKELKSNALVLDNITFDEKTTMVLSEYIAKAEQVGLVTTQMKEAVERAIRDNDNYALLHILSLFKFGGNANVHN